MKESKVAVLCGYAFPEGMAPSIRILAYCNGLQQNGIQTEIFSFHRLVRDGNSVFTGEARDIRFTCTYVTTHKTAKGMLAFWEKVKMVWRTLKAIKRSNKEKRIDHIFLSFDSLLFLYVFVPFLSILGIKCVFIADEFPEPIRQLKSDLPKWHYLAYRIIFRKVEKRVFMTKALQNFYDSRVSVCPTFIMSSILEASRFQKVKRDSAVSPYLCYMGNMQLAKDDVLTIIKAFYNIAEEFPSLELRLYGTPNQRDREQVEQQIKMLNIGERVRLMGRINYDEVPAVLSQASLLVTAQPNTKRAEGGFPTKMAEYMMSGSPMLVTDVGEIHLYVADGENTFMVPPESPELYAAKIRYILEHPAVAEQVAKNAYDYAVRGFDSKYVTKELVKFLES